MPSTPGWAQQKIMSISRRAFLIALLCAFLWVGSAFAHAAYLRSMPGENAVVSDAPTRVDIWFTQELFRRQGENLIQVFDPSEQPVQAGEALVDNDDRTHLWVDLEPNLSPGIYRVEWNSLSAEDGDSEEGMFSFTFDPQAETTSTPMLTNSSATPADGLAEEPTDESSSQVAAQTDTPQATQSEDSSPGNRCFAGMIPVMGLMGIVSVSRLRRFIIK